MRMLQLPEFSDLLVKPLEAAFGKRHRDEAMHQEFINQLYEGCKFFDSHLLGKTVAKLRNNQERWPSIKVIRKEYYQIAKDDNSNAPSYIPPMPEKSYISLQEMYEVCDRMVVPRAYAELAKTGQIHKLCSNLLKTPQEIRAQASDFMSLLDKDSRRYDLPSNQGRSEEAA